MKVIAINGSGRKKNTHSVLVEVADLLKNHDIKTEILNLNDFNIKQCLGCEVCMKSDSCHIDDDIPILVDKLINCDGVILSSPVYMGNVSGTLKTFLDRLCQWYHRPRLVGTPVMLVATTAGSSLNYVQKYMENVSISLGMHPTDKISKTIRDLDKPIGVQDIKGFQDHLFKKVEQYKPSLNQIINFNIQKVLAMTVLEEDKEYWQRKGWDVAPFYYNCKISFFKKALGNIFFRILFRVISKERNKYIAKD